MCKRCIELEIEIEAAEEYGFGFTSFQLQEELEALQNSHCPTKHAPDVVESAASVSIPTASEVSASEADSTPATTQVM